MHIFQNPLLLNSFYYPNIAFVLIPYLCLLQVAIFVIPAVILYTHRRTILSLISKDYVFSLLAVLFVIVVSRITVMFFNASYVQMLPEKIFAMNMVGRDWLDGVMEQVIRLWLGSPFDPLLVYGKGFIGFLGLLLYPLFKTGICNSGSLIRCSQAGYVIMTATVLISYLVIICCAFKSVIRNVLLIGFVTFILGYGGSLGLERGNIDILFSLIILMLYIVRKNRVTNSGVFVFIEACILGLLCSSKITILPLALAFVFTSKQLVVSSVYLIFWYCVWSLSPALFGTPSSLLDSFVSATIYGKLHYSNMLLASCQSSNYGLIGIASLFILCSFSVSAINNPLFLVILYFLYIILVGIVVLIPLIPLVIQLRMMNKKVSECIRFTYKNRNEFILLLLILGVVSINLLPFAAAASYRLYFSFSVLIAAWYSVTDVKAKQLLLFSTMCLLLKGVWGMDVKILNILVALHYATLISASVIELKDVLRTKGRLI